MLLEVKNYAKILQAKCIKIAFKIRVSALLTGLNGRPICRKANAEAFLSSLQCPITIKAESIYLKKNNTEEKKI